ncbi:hypothetical protein [Cecembia calidifontis]|jgi:hypothetical protein|uniref:Uncharacterized protein n=1 Tax=Cecembia calidifontis TaxID=1187080 RepID=A0A4Q7PFC0_9BACT|nr:hypothetical protein [Cecembia calidifontis]RZS98370.1 hypothetical protein BC751_4017 [Cecembia calidifontis]
MKKINLFLMGLALSCLSLSYFSTTNQVIAAPKTGKWVDVYGGGSTPSGAYCASSWKSKCLVGDRKSYNIQ